MDPLSGSKTPGSQQQTGSRSTKPSDAQVRAATQAINNALRNQPYAIAGGAACSLGGSTRETEEIDIVVPKGATKDARRMLRNQPMYFDIDSRTLHTYFKSTPRIEILILTPPLLFRERFDSNTPVVVVDGVKILMPAKILNALCNSILGRVSDEKKEIDALDIKFCLRWCVNNNTFPTQAEVPRADRGFVEWFIIEYGEAEYWKNAGYNRQRGMLPPPVIFGSEY